MKNYEVCNMLKINEIFGPTIQGEGKFIGYPVVFVRLWGCVAPYCSFCDTKYSWQDEAINSTEMTVKEVVDKVKTLSKDGLVIISGGEPFAQEGVYSLIDEFEDEGFNTQIESSGKSLIDYDRINDDTVICFSPKYYKDHFHFNIKNLDVVGISDYFKFVVATGIDMDRINKFVKENNIKKDMVYLMPLGATRDEQMDNMQFVAEQAIEHNYKMSPRLHTLIWGNVKGK